MKIFLVIVLMLLIAPVAGWDLPAPDPNYRHSFNETGECASIGTKYHTSTVWKGAGGPDGSCLVTPNVPNCNLTHCWYFLLPMGSPSARKELDQKINQSWHPEFMPAV